MYLLPLLINLICLQNKSGHLFQEKKKYWHQTFEQ